MKRVSEPAVGRLSVYLRLLAELAAQGVATVSSGELAAGCGTSAAQVRKDLSLFGSFGKRGQGYGVGELQRELRRILGLERRWRVALVGAGKIGAALMAYQDFRRQGFDVVAVFDRDPDKVSAAHTGLRVQSDADLRTGLAGIDIVIVAVPADSAQRVVDDVVAGGVRAILNFAPTRLEVPAGVSVKNVNMALELEGLSYALVNERPGGRSVKSRSAASRG